MINTRINFAGVEFKNPFVAASGTFGFGREYAEFYDLSEIGGVSTKGMTIRPRCGNPTPRIAESACGIVNSVGLENPGVDAFIDRDLDFLKQRTRVIANVAGSTVEDYVAAVRKLDGLVDMIELNISCPNVKEGGVAFGILPDSVNNITRKVKDALAKTPLMVKLSPNVASIADNARAAEAGGADAISLVNTFTAMAIDVRTRRPLLANVTGGLSGAAIMPVALRMVYEASRAVKIPVMGMGGITCGEDAVRFMLAGASMVQVGTANLSSPNAMLKIKEEFEEYMVKYGVAEASELTGALIV